MIKTTEQPDSVPEAQGKRVGLPYDFRKPTVARVKSRIWNSEDPRIFTPKAFGMGYDLNFYWVTHPMGYAQGRRKAG